MQRGDLATFMKEIRDEAYKYVKKFDEEGFKGWLHQVIWDDSNTGNSMRLTFNESPMKVKSNVGGSHYEHYHEIFNILSRADLAKLKNVDSWESLNKIFNLNGSDTDRKKYFAARALIFIVATSEAMRGHQAIDEFLDALNNGLDGSNYEQLLPWMKKGGAVELYKGTSETARNKRIREGRSVSPDKIRNIKNKAPVRVKSQGTGPKKNIKKKSKKNNAAIKNLNGGKGKVKAVQNRKKKTQKNAAIKNLKKGTKHR